MVIEMFFLGYAAKIIYTIELRNKCDKNGSDIEENRKTDGDLHAVSNRNDRPPASIPISTISS